MNKILPLSLRHAMTPAKAVALCAALCAAAPHSTALANDPANNPVNNPVKATVTVNGKALDKNVTQMTFDGDKVTLTCDDKTTLTADMDAVTFVWSHATAIAMPLKKATDKNDGKVYDLNGRYRGRDAQKRPHGVYIVNGKKTLEQTHH